MLLEFLFVEGFEMLRECLRHNRLYVWLASLGTPCELEWLEDLLIRRLELEFLRLVVRHPELIGRRSCSPRLA